MTLNRREFLELLAAAGVSTMASSWLVDRVVALAEEGELAVAPGPGIETWVPTACGLCQGGCGLEIRRIDGLPVGVRGLAGHPVNRGKLCSLPHAAIQMLFSPDRVRRPLKRAGRRGQGLWTEITWNEAEESIKQRLLDVIRAGARDEVAFLDGRLSGLGREVASGFLRGVGSGNHIAPIESRADVLANRMFGWVRAAGADLARSRIVLLFRFDYLETDGSPVWQTRVHAQARDRTIDRPVYVSIGPRLFGSAAKSDYWLAARPGTEGIVAAAIAHVILDNDWQDGDFLSRKSDWPRDLAGITQPGLHRLVTSITPAVAAEITGIPVPQIEDTARRFVEHQPGVALAGPGTPANPTEMLTLALVMFLNVLVGAVGKQGTLIELPPPVLAPIWSETRETGHDEATKIGNTNELTRALLERDPTPINLLFIREANPAFDIPTARLLRRGLTSADCMVVVFATEMDETAKLADIVLPEPTFLERWDLLTETPVIPAGYATLQQPVIEPLFSSRQSEETLARVANALGNLSHVQFSETNPERMVERASRGLFEDKRGRIAAPTMSGEPSDPVGDSWAAFRSSISWAFDAAVSTHSPENQRIATDLGPLLNLPGELSFDRVRDVVSPRSLGSADLYPYELVVFRTQQLRDGGSTNLPMMMELAGHWAGTMWETWAEMHPRSAVQAGVTDGDLVRIASEIGYIDAKLRVSNGTPPGLVAVPLGFGRELGSTAGGIGDNVNLILASGLTDPSWEGHERVTRVTVTRI